MTVKQLVKYLKGFPQNLEIIVARDSEGNSFSPVAEIGENTYIPENQYRGDISGSTEDPNCLVFWPTN